MPELASLAIVGAAVSVLVQLVKSNGNFSANSVRALVVALSVVAAVGYSVFDGYGLTEAFVQILALANTVYLFAIRLFEE